MKRLIVLLTLTLGLTACDGVDVSDAASGAASLVVQAPLATGAIEHWAQMSPEEFWQHIAALDSTVTVGLKEAAAARGVDGQGRSLVPRALWTTLAATVSPLASSVVENVNPVDGLHPVIVLRLTGPGQVQALRSSPLTQFVEPASFDPADVLMSSCGSSDAVENGAVAPSGDVIPYTLARHRVPQAWFYSAGSGKTVGVVDTGASVYQPQVQERFSTGQSTGRTIGYDFSDSNGLSGPPPYHDTCGHGTKMLGLALAPLDGVNIAGVAYKANGFSIRALDEPTQGPGQWAEIREGIRRAALNSDIVNLSFGWTWGNSDVTQTIQHYYYNGAPGRSSKTLFFGAAGSGSQSLGNVVYPADLAEVLAVAGTLDGQTPCPGCNYGEQVEFTAFTAGETTGSNTNGVSDKNAAGKSSGATALMSGLAAVVWSRYPTLSRDALVQRLRQASSFASSRRQDVGFGVTDAYCAVGGLCRAFITGPNAVTVNQPSRFTVTTATLDAPASGRFTYRWSNGATTRTTDYVTTSCPGETDYVSVTITDTADGSRRTESRQVTVQDDGSGGNGGLCYSSGF